jgi:hypothetical protein
MHRTQIYLEEGHYRILLNRARRDGKTISALIREIVDEHFGFGSEKRSDPFDDVIGIGKGDGSRVAENYEEYLYGKKS